jgi:hypothetical protein
VLEKNSDVIEKMLRLVSEEKHLMTQAKKEKQRHLNDARRAFEALGQIVFPDDERRQPGGAFSPRILDYCEGAMSGMAMVIAQLEAEFEAGIR